MRAIASTTALVLAILASTMAVFAMGTRPEEFRDVVIGNEGGSLTAEVSATDARAVTFTADGGGTAFSGGAWLDFGDGVKEMICEPGEGCGRNAAAHSYVAGKTYRAELIGVGEDGSKVLGTVDVTIPG